MNISNKQLFFSHTWQNDRLRRNTHMRVYDLAKKMRRCGWSIWIDEEEMRGNIDAAMANGIDGAEAIIVCLTESYCKKVNETAMDPRKRDSCLKEWTYANARNKLMIPVVMEPYLLSQKNWPPGIVSLEFGSTLYINACAENLNNATISLSDLLRKHGLQPNYNTARRASESDAKSLVNTKNLVYINLSILNHLLTGSKAYTDHVRSQKLIKAPSKYFKLGLIRRWGSTGQLTKVSI